MEATDGRGRAVDINWCVQVLELARVAVLGTDKDGRVDRWNLAACEIYGYTEIEASRRPANFLCSPGESTALMTLAAGNHGREIIEHHRRKDGSAVLVGLSVISVAGGLLAIVRDATHGHQAASLATKNRQALEESRRELKRLARRMVDAQEAERQRIAFELHDDFKQRLGFVTFELAALAATQDTTGLEETNRKLLNKLAGTVSDVGRDLRWVAHQLHPAPLDRLGLAATLEAHAADIESRTGLPVRVSLVLTEIEPTNRVALGIYRIAQEALENVVRHAEARNVHLTLVCEGSQILLSVADNGLGFDPDAASSQGGLGLCSMKERAQLLGGRLRVASALGASTEIELTLPLAAASEEEVGGAPPAVDQNADESSHRRRLIGPYQLLNVLGEGAMAVVYLAREPPPLGRQVALKVYRVPLAQRHRVLSFKAEYQALARIRHPNVGLIHEARTTEDGDPYIVMEHVPGIPLTEYCNRYRLDLRQRIALFLTICETVQHIHRKGVLHRDLKPANILVMEEDGRAIPKIVDFGIAKGLDHPLAEGTVWTRGTFGTPAYISPEVLAGNEGDTRSDVYALGVILYELLTGVRPFDDEAKVLSQLAQGLLKLPSQRMKVLTTEQLETAAGNRRIGAPGLHLALRGDLDWITAKALAAEPEQRYDGASALAEDLDRHLRNEPLMAGPPDLSYRLSRLVRRHRAAVVAAALVFVTLIGGLVTTTWQARRATREALEAEHVTKFLEELFRVAAPGEARGNTITAREVLDRGTARLRRELASQPRLRARLMETIGNVYRLLGLYDEARPHLEEAVELRRRVLGENHLETMGSLRTLAHLNVDAGRPQEAEPLLEKILGIQERTLGMDPLETAETLDVIALAKHRLANDPIEADALTRRAYDLVSSVLPPEDPRSIRALSNLSRSALILRNYDEATIHLRRALELAEEYLDPNHPDMLRLLLLRAILHSGQGEDIQAQILYERMIPRWARVLGEDHSHTLNIRLNLVGIYARLGRVGLAHRTASVCLQQLERKFGANHSTTLRATTALGNLSYQRGEFEEARAIYQRSLRVATSVDPVGRSALQLTLALARVVYAMGDLAETERLSNSLLALSPSESIPSVSIGAKQMLADIFYARGDLDRAETLSRELHSVLEGGSTIRHRQLESVQNRLRLGKLLAARSDMEGAREHWEFAIELTRLSPHNVQSQAWQAIALFSLGRVEKARPIAQRALRGVRNPALIEFCELHGIEIPPLGG